MHEQATNGYQLSPQQAHDWLVQQQQHGTCDTTVVLTLQGCVDESALQAALRRVVSRHEILRTTFHQVSGLKVPLQVVITEPELSWNTGCMDGLAGIQASYARPAADRSTLKLTMPSLLADPPSIQVLIDELGLAYAGEQIPESSVTYAQIAQWQLDLLDSDDEDARPGKTHWNKIATAAACSSLPHRAASTSGAFGPALVQKLQSMADRLAVSIADVILAAAQCLLLKLGESDRFLVSVFSDGREIEELSREVGLIGRMLPVEVRLDGNLRFSDAVAQVHEGIQQATQWREYYSPDAISEDKITLAFDFAEVPAPRVYGGVTFRIEQLQTWRPAFPLRLSLLRRQNEILWELHGDASGLSDCLLTLLQAAVDNPDSPISRLPILNPDQRRRMIVDWNQTGADFPRDRCIHQLVESQADRTPDRLAVRCGDASLSYRDLNRQANRLAHHLRSLGVGPDSPVALCLDRSVELIVALLGILKAGGAYVPLSAEHPPSRLSQQFKGAVVLVTDSVLLQRLPEFDGPVVCVDPSAWESQPDTNPALLTGPENLVYVLFTSGSTGVPKGVAVRHRNLVNYTWFARQLLELEKYPQGLQFGMVSTICADVGITCIFPALTSGGCLHLIVQDIATDSQRMGRYAATHCLDVLKIVPSHLAALLDGESGKAVLPAKFLVVGGEKLRRELVEQVVASGVGCQLINHYAPTETTCGSLTLRVLDFDWRTWKGPALPLGRPIANTRVYVLDSEREPVPVGVLGELYIAGDGVSAGYTGDAERTAQRFLPDPFHPGGTMYRSGDLVRYLADGTVEFVDRVDDQVKIRGYRVELGEVEAVLRRHAAVKQVVVLAKEDERGDKRLVAYVAGDRLNGEELRDYFKNRLPDYMVPAAVVVMIKLPLNANGKIDRQALPEPELIPRIYIAPGTPIEASVAAVWEEVFRRKRIGVDEQFFEIGGHSLLATQIAARLRERLKLSLSVRTIFDYPTIRSLADTIDENRDEWADDLEAIVMFSRRG